MPSIKYLMLRSAPSRRACGGSSGQGARLEARITPVQPMRRSFLDSFRTSEEPPGAADARLEARTAPDAAVFWASLAARLADRAKCRIAQPARAHRAMRARARERARGKEGSRPSD